MPQHKLARLPILNRFLEHNVLAVAVEQQLNTRGGADRHATKGMFLLSRLVTGYRDVCTLTECMMTQHQHGEGDAGGGDPGGADVQHVRPFMEWVEAGRAPQFARVDDGRGGGGGGGGVVVPIVGLMGVLAVAQLLGDTDVLGGSGKNAGYVVERDDASGRAAAVRIVKIDAGESFSFDAPYNQFRRSFDGFGGGNRLADKKDVQFGNMHPASIRWSLLTAGQRHAFLQALRRGLDFLDHGEALDLSLIHI